MDIGEPQRTIIVEPVKSPVPERDPARPDEQPPPRRAPQREPAAPEPVP